MTTFRHTSPSADRWLDEAALCTTLLSGRYRDELGDLLNRTRRLLSASAPNDSGRQLILAAARRTVTQIDKQLVSLIPQAPEDGPALVHAHTACDRLLACLSHDA